jgi:predicted O-methyltransferase YrrM
MAQFDEVLREVDRRCREQHIPMLGVEKAEFLAELVEKAKPSLIVECGTAIGYSGLWMASKLKAAGKGRLITVEINPDRAREAQQNFARAGVGDRVDSRIGDAREVTKAIGEPVDFLLLDNDYGNYYPCFRAIESRLVDGAVIVADNVGIGANRMADYLEHVRSRYESQTHWFDTDLPWVKRDAMEMTIYRKDRV